MTGIAIAVAFFVLFASMSAGLDAFIEEEMTRPRPVDIVLESGSVTPFTQEQVDLIALAALASEEDTGVAHHTTTRARVPVTSETELPVWIWGVDVLEGGAVTTPPYATDVPLQWGRHLDPSDMLAGTGVVCVIGARAWADRYPGAVENSTITVRADGTVDPWRTVEATDYPVEGKAQVTAVPRGPLRARVVGVMSPGGGDELDWGVFVPVTHLLDHLGQVDGARGAYYPQVVVTVVDGNRVDVRDLENTLVATIPGIEGTDDAWETEEFEATYGGASRALDGWLVVVSAILVVLLVAGVSDTTLVAVTERRREIATLRAVGVGRRQVTRLVLHEVMVLASLGLAIGLVVGTVLALTFGHMHEVTGGEGVFLAPVSMDPWVVAGAATLALGAAVAAALYPSSRASKGHPMEALRYE